MNKENDNEWVCPICGGESYSSIIIVNNKFYTCNKCSVIFIDKERFDAIKITIDDISEDIMNDIGRTVNNGM